MPGVGLLRSLDEQGWRHVYGAGRWPEGRPVGELGALHVSGGDGRVPVWLVAGRVVTPAYAPRARPPGPLRLARWVLAPLRWRDFEGPAARLRLTAERARAAPRLRARPAAHPATPDGPPAGYLEAVPGPGRMPLHAAVHPVTGDQMVTTDEWEVAQLGYGDRALLGYLEASAPVSGRRGCDRPPLPWAYRAGRPPAATPPSFEHPTGAIDDPRLALGIRRLPTTVAGWAISPDATVARVELTVGGTAVGAARLGLQRPDVAALTGLVDAPVCGFEAELERVHIPSGSMVVELGAIATSASGASWRLPTIEVAVDGEAATGPPPAAVPPAPTPRRSAPAGDPASVLVVAHSLSLGGAQLYLVEVLERLVASGAVAGTVMAPTDGPLRSRLEACGLEVRLSPPPPIDDVGPYEGRLDELVAWTRGHDFELVFANTLLSFWAADLARRLGIPSAMAIHESTPLETWWSGGVVDDGVWGRLLGALSSAGALVFEAEATRRMYLPYAGAERLLTLPYGLELAPIDALMRDFDGAASRRAHGLPERAPVIACLGTLDPRKAQVPLLQAFGAVLEDWPEATLALVGVGGAAEQAPYADALREYIGRAGIGARTRLVPMLENPHEWQAMADVLACPSDKESLPRVVMEGMAVGTPVLATDIFGLPELIEDGVTGFLCPPRDTRALVEHLRRVLSKEPDELRAVADAARTRVRERHDPERRAAELSDLLRSLR